MMGDIADAMLDGTLCQGCGEYLGGDGPGYCVMCAGDNLSQSSFSHAQISITKEKCPHCKKRVKQGGLFNHIKDVHPEINANALKAAEDLLSALNGLLKKYVDLVNCGDCGNWNPEAEKEVIAARAAIRKAEDKK